jgi:steroid 5-alpha reductase family enzyme
LTDLAGGTNFIVLAIVGVALCKSVDSVLTDRQLINSILVMIWGVRLSGFLFYRIMIFGTDQRFDGTREDPCKFLIFWVMQMSWVFIVSLPLTMLNGISNHCREDLIYSDYIGFVVACIGLIIETVADQTKLDHK